MRPCTPRQHRACVPAHRGRRNIERWRPRSRGRFRPTSATTSPIATAPGPISEQCGPAPRRCVRDRPRLSLRVPPAWWQLWKGLYHAGVDLIVTPWPARAVAVVARGPQPVLPGGRAFRVRAGCACPGSTGHPSAPYRGQPAGHGGGPVFRDVICAGSTPRWRRHLEAILEAEKDVAAVVVFTVPMRATSAGSRRRCASASASRSSLRR